MAEKLKPWMGHKGIDDEFMAYLRYLIDGLKTLKKACEKKSNHRKPK